MSNSAELTVTGAVAESALQRNKKGKPSSLELRIDIPNSAGGIAFRVTAYSILSVPLGKLSKGKKGTLYTPDKNIKAAEEIYEAIRSSKGKTGIFKGLVTDVRESVLERVISMNLLYVNYPVGSNFERTFDIAAFYTSRGNQ